MGILEIKDATLRFGGVVALDHVSYEVQEGEIFRLLGQMAQEDKYAELHKRTIQAIIWFHPLQGGDITRYKPHKRASMGIARAFQNIELFPHLSVLDNLMLGRHVRMKTGLLAGGFYWGKAQREEIEHRKKLSR